MDPDTKTALAALREHLDALATITEAEHEAIKGRLEALEKKLSTTFKLIRSATDVITSLSTTHP